MSYWEWNSEIYYGRLNRLVQGASAGYKIVGGVYDVGSAVLDWSAGISLVDNYATNEYRWTLLPAWVFSNQVVYFSTPALSTGSSMLCVIKSFALDYVDIYVASPYLQKIHLIGIGI